MYSREAEPRTKQLLQLLTIIYLIPTGIRNARGHEYRTAITPPTRCPILPWTRERN